MFYSTAVVESGPGVCLTKLLAKSLNGCLWEVHCMPWLFTGNKTLSFIFTIFLDTQLSGLRRRISYILALPSTLMRQSDHPKISRWDELIIDYSLLITISCTSPLSLPFAFVGAIILRKDAWGTTTSRFQFGVLFRSVMEFTYTINCSASQN